ncbi:MAG TPA: DNA repair protein RadC [Gemmatimonadaceae bacterium]|nr:DNA repair protein RadC [Gemmatimonadaceae bacterium]
MTAIRVAGTKSEAGPPSGTAIRELPSAERPRERMRHLGAQALSTAELLALLIGSGGAGRSALAVGQALLASAGGSLRRLASQPPAALRAVAGVGPARAATVHAALELGRRAAVESRDEGAPVRSPRDVYALFGPRLEDLPVEEFHVAVLDSQHRLERDVTITRGILNSSLVHPREVFREAIAERAAAIILVHNHPSGDPTPSADDRAVTDQLAAAGRLLDIPVHDHLIVGRGRYVSFAEAGLL